MLCRALRERGHKVLLVSFKRQYPQWLFPGRSDRDPSKKPLEAEEAKYWIDPLNPLTWLASFGRIRQYRPDAVILQWWTLFWSSVWLVIGVLNHLLIKKPLIYICHNVLPHEARFWDQWLTGLVLRWGTHFIVQSTDEKEELATSIPGKPISVVPLPVFDMFAHEQIPQAEARRQLNLPIDIPVMLFFGIVREYKGLQDLLLAMPEVQSRLGQALLVIAGEFWEDKRAYLDMVEQLGIGKLVIIDDRYIPNECVPLYFSAADVLVAPYRRVTGSGVVQMALGCGFVRHFSAGLTRSPGPPKKSNEHPPGWDTLIDVIESFSTNLLLAT
jgi:glycosyltransferase involved in cell wall biosynthesis